MKVGTPLPGLSTANTLQLLVGDRVRNLDGKKAVVKFGVYRHHIVDHISTVERGLSSLAYGAYFDGDEGFFLSDHIYEDGTMDVFVDGR